MRMERIWLVMFRLYPFKLDTFVQSILPLIHILENEVKLKIKGQDSQKHLRIILRVKTVESSVISLRFKMYLLTLVQS